MPPGSVVRDTTGEENDRSVKGRKAERVWERHLMRTSSGRSESFGSNRSRVGPLYRMTVLLDEELTCFLRQGRDLSAMVRCYFRGSGAEGRCYRGTGAYLPVENHVTRMQSSWNLTDVASELLNSGERLGEPQGVLADRPY
jgi:hypothetical protein